MNLYTRLLRHASKATIRRFIWQVTKTKAAEVAYLLAVVDLMATLVEIKERLDQHYEG